MFYIEDCGYGRSRLRRRWKVLPVTGMLVLTLGLGGVTTVMAGQNRAEQNAETVNMEEALASKMESDMELLYAQNSVVTPVQTLNTEIKSDKEIVVIDPGHGGEDEGCARAGVEEKEINLQIGLALRDKLEQMGYEVLLTRETDVEVSLEERANLANAASADVYVSIHQNAWDTSDVTGVETWYHADESNPNPESHRLAKLVHQKVLEATQEKDRDLREDDTLYVIRETKMASCLVETGFLSNAKNRKELCDAEYQAKIVAGIASAIELYFHPKTMYLTFDDGPTAENTVAVLDILKEKNIKATFFVVGENVRKHPEVAKRIVAEGHTIGIHCNSHDYKKIYKSADAYLEDFEEAYQAVYEVTGVKAQLFRFPGGSVNAYNKKVYKEIIEEMTKQGYIYFDWNASLEDAVSKSDPKTLLRNARESTLGRQKVVMLGHDVIYNTTLCLEDLIEQFPEYEMKPLTPEVEPIQF